MATVERDQLEGELRLKLAVDPEVRHAAEDFADDVADMWVRVWNAMGPHPYETGGYENSIMVFREVAHRERIPKGSPGAGTFTGKILYRYWVGTDHPHAHFIEYGTGYDQLGAGVWQDLDGKWHKSPKTPTPEFAPAGVTATIYHGTGPD